MKETILCLSSQRWRDPLWTNKQHVMSRMKEHYRVVHVDYGLRPLPQYLVERAWHHRRSLWPPHRALTDGVVPVEEDLYLGDAYSPLVAGAFPHAHPVRDFFTFDAKVLMARRFLKRTKSKPIVWVYHPGFADAVERVDRKLLVYDCVDNYEAFPTYRDDPGWLMAREERLCRNADLVFCTSRALYESRREFNPENTFLVHNVGDAEHFGAALLDSTEVPEEIASLEGPVVGFVGAVSDYKLNMEWLIRTAEARPEWNLVVIGPVGMADPTTEVGALRALKNVHLLGRRDYQELPKYLKGFDVAVIPYRLNAYTESVFPIKFFEFLATGKPVVISDLPALREFSEYVGVARDAGEFIEWCEAYLEDDDPEERAARVEVARLHSWPQRVGTLREHVERKLAELQQG